MTEEARKIAESMANRDYQRARARLLQAMAECEDCWSVLTKFTRDVMPGEPEALSQEDLDRIQRTFFGNNVGPYVPNSGVRK